MNLTAASFVGTVPLPRGKLRATASSRFPLAGEGGAFVADATPIGTG